MGELESIHPEDEAELLETFESIAGPINFTECEHPHDHWEIEDTEQTVEYWGAPLHIGNNWVVCGLCGEDVTDLATPEPPDRIEEF